MHVSSGAGVALVAEARARGVDATCEVCPHHLLLDEEDAVRLGAVAKCALAELFAGAAARRLALPGKGSVTRGADADLVLVDLDAVRVLRTTELRSRHRISPYVGRRLRGRVVRTILRGRTVALVGEVAGPARGRVVRVRTAP